MAFGIGARKEVRRAEIPLGCGNPDGVDRLDAAVVNEPMGKPRSKLPRAGPDGHAGMN
jgi:hypothetical protein